MSDDESAIRKGVVVLAGFVLGEMTIADTLSRLVSVTCEAVVRADMVGITRRLEGQMRTAVFSDDEMPAIDSVQYKTGVGPSVEAFRNRRSYRIESTTDDRTWPAFSALAAAHGIVSTLSYPLAAHDETLGAFNLYSRAGMFSAHDEGIGQVLATQAAIALAHWHACVRSKQLEEAMRSRAVIEQAKGVLMARGGVSPDDGFQILVRASSRENRRLRHVAEDIVRDAQTSSQLDGTPPSS